MNLESEVKLSSPIGDIELSRFKVQDVPVFMNYLYDSPKGFLESIGFDISKFSAREDREYKFIQSIKAEEQRDTFFRVAARFNGRTIAAVNMPEIEMAEGPRAHFHIFDPSLRGKGLGVSILRGGLKILMSRHNVKRLLIEPKADNVRMNRLMLKCGFNDLGPCMYHKPMTQNFPARRYEVLAANL
jgi:RimJ/RimL family protein N-acetyltransferase